MKIYIKYLWIIPALYVSYQFGNKIFEVLLNGTEEFASIISVVPFLNPFSNILAYLIGIFDLAIALLLLIIPSTNSTKKYSKYIFLWVIVWPLIPSSLRYFGGVADFEIVEVSTMILSALVSYWLFKKFNR